MPYTPPNGDAVDFTWVGASAYTPPAGDAVDFQWQVDAYQARIAVPGPLGVAVLRANYGLTVETRIVVPGPLGLVALRARPVVVARVAVPGPLGVAGAQARVVRYRLRGEVRDHGVLVDRRVRAYRRSDGALVAQGDTAAGAFDLMAGFSDDEYTVIAIDLGSGATDYKPPATNRVVSVLVQD